ncbi:nuclear transport factor 2 family protein [Flavobacterium sp. DG1-102-2]|uniref:nuclear transport factor 2 family protein n=1 Tax=Flavobacterium sp. DG1-102-2 TaxID=3081663 RepID=UPI002948D501|nr:nuclear transport factor 2 family protein [Flavobacterium sp. DG1-102-2]MDV6168128.1 nuclear transport factor 2 family protein [Flavobacterium sp. DG1-102-2]
MNDDTIAKKQELIENAYKSFNARNIDAILNVMHPDVKWSRAWEGDYATGHEDVREYWERQWKEINPNVNPVGFCERDNGTFEVTVDQLVKDLEGNILFNGRVFHIYVINDGMIYQMDIEQN